MKMVWDSFQTVCNLNQITHNHVKVEGDILKSLQKGIHLATVNFKNYILLATEFSNDKHFTCNIVAVIIK